MKRSIQWHKKCAENNQKSVNSLAAEVKRKTMHLERKRAELYVYKRQILRAEKEKRDGFDRDRYKPMQSREACTERIIKYADYLDW